MAEFIGFLLFSVIPLTAFLLYFLDMLCLGLVITLLLIPVLLYVVVPIVFYYCTPFQRLVVFLNLYENPRVYDFSDPKVMLAGTRNFYIDVPFGKETDKLGVWHILSNKSMADLGQPTYPIEDSLFNEALHNNTQLVFIYLHGNSNTRAAKHRKELYKVLRKLGHVFTFDYRGYADSTYRPPSEEQLVEDTLAVYNWLLDKKIDRFWPVIWGHSLGTAVATNVCTRLNQSIKGLVLEAPFTNMTEEVRNHPLGKLFSWLPYFDNLILEPFRDAGSPFAFKSDENIKKLKNSLVKRIAILHADDDHIVPIKMGRRMCDLGRAYYAKGNVNNVEWMQFASGGHDEICQQPDFFRRINDFLNF